MKSNYPQSCPCDLAQSYARCCGRYHGGAAAPDALSLMRARYSAYALGLQEFILASWHPSTRPLSVPHPQPVRWQGLTIDQFEIDPTSPNIAFVRFVARYKINGRAWRLQECSRFQLIDGRWLYVDGQIGQAGQRSVGQSD